MKLQALTWIALSLKSRRFGTIVLKRHRALLTSRKISLKEGSQHQMGISISKYTNELWTFSDTKTLSGVDTKVQQRFIFVRETSRKQESRRSFSDPNYRTDRNTGCAGDCLLARRKPPGVCRIVNM